jgi:RNA polymerase sigma factor (sigma-70 family)
MPRDEAIEVGDSQIVALLCAASEQGARLLLQVHGPRVKWLLHDRFGDILAEPDLAAALSEAAFKAFRAIRMFDASKGTLGAWFWQIAANAARNVLRGEIRHAHQNLAHDPPGPARTAASLDDGDGPTGNETLDSLREAIEALPDLQRKIIQADLASRDVASAAWLAERYGTTPASIYVSRGKAHENLRKALVQRGHSQDGKVMP